MTFSRRVAAHKEAERVRDEGARARPHMPAGWQSRDQLGRCAHHGCNADAVVRVNGVGACAADAHLEWLMNRTVGPALDALRRIFGEVDR